MAWRRRVNGALAQITGYRIVRADPSAPAPARRPPKPERIRNFHDEDARAAMRASKPRTMTSHERLFALIVAVRYVVEHRIPGDVAECGVWRGGSMQAVALTLLQLGAADRTLHLYDTFEGMPAPADVDRRLRGRPAAELLERGPRARTVRAAASLQDVRQGMAETGYPAELVRFHRGRVEETIPADAPERLALLRLDTDWYESTRHELEHLYDRLAPGGVLIVDDYDYWEGSRKAVDEFLERRGLRLLLVPIDTARIAVKP